MWRCPSVFMKQWVSPVAPLFLPNSLWLHSVDSSILSRKVPFPSWNCLGFFLCAANGISSSGSVKKIYWILHGLLWCLHAWVKPQRCDLVFLHGFSLYLCGSLIGVEMLCWCHLNIVSDEQNPSRSELLKKQVIPFLTQCLLQVLAAWAPKKW